jgi:hypothetical protein
MWKQANQSIIIAIATSLSRYDLSNLDDDYIHLTNTCRSAEDIAFDEVEFVKVSKTCMYISLSCDHNIMAQISLDD